MPLAGLPAVLMHHFMCNPWSIQLCCKPVVSECWYDCWLQDQASQSLGAFVAVPEAGTIAAKASKTVTLTLEASRLGRIQLPVYIRIAGSRNKPLQLVADAKALGPWLEFAVARAIESAAQGSTDGSATPAVSCSGAATSLGLLDGGGSSTALAALAAESSSASQFTLASGAKRTTGAKAKGPKGPQWGPSAAITFDKVQVLQPHAQKLLLRNPTLINSEVKLFVEGRDSVFEVRKPSGLAALSRSGP